MGWVWWINCVYLCGGGALLYLSLNCQGHCALVSLTFKYKSLAHFQFFRIQCTSISLYQLYAFFRHANTIFGINRKWAVLSFSHCRVVPASALPKHVSVSHFPPQSGERHVHHHFDKIISLNNWLFKYTSISTMRGESSGIICIQHELNNAEESQTFFVFCFFFCALVREDIFLMPQPEWRLRWLCDVFLAVRLRDITVYWWRAQAYRGGGGGMIKSYRKYWYTRCASLCIFQW